MTINTLENSKFLKIKLKNNTKEALEIGWQTDLKTHYTEIDLNIFNAAYPCGEMNNIIVLDVDKKDNGIEAIEDFKSKYGDINTFTVNTPNGGHHLYFNYNSQNEADDYLLKEFKNHTKLGGVGLDIRTERGYIVAPGSSIDGKYYNIINNVPICDMPSALISWLTAFKVKAKGPTRNKTNVINQTVNNEYTYTVTDIKIKEILEALPESYLNNYSDWLRASTVLKFHNKYNLWDEWSKKSTKYNEFQNIKTWNSIKGKIDINYLCAVAGLDRINKYIPINYEMRPDNKNIDYIEYNNKYVFDKAYKKEQLDYKKFEYNDTIILKGTAGTGKTTAISKHIKNYLEENPEIKFIDVVDRITLNDQHMKSFKEINIKSYKNKNNDPYSAKSFIICINSLQRLAALTKEDKNKYIVFIDEVTSFISNLTHSDTIKDQKIIYNLLTSIIKNAKKVIVADAIIMDNTLDFLKSRINEDNKTLFIYNKFKKFEGVEAINIKDENLFLNKIINQCKAGKPFLFGCDKANITTRYYNKCKLEIEIILEEAIRTATEAEAELAAIKSETTKKPTDKEVKKALIKATKANKAKEDIVALSKSFLLLTAETDIEIYDAEEQFKNKFVFYSPKITYGVDFSIDTAQNVYIYQTGIIMPNGTFQQSTRCRNIEKLYYYSDSQASREIFNKTWGRTLDGTRKIGHDIEDRNKSLNNISYDLKERIENFQIFNSSLYNISTTYNEDKEIYEVNENSFFGLYCYTEYINNIYNTNMTEHYKDILINNGFVLSEEGETLKLSKDLKKEINQITKDIEENIFNEFIEANDKTEEKFKPLIHRIEKLLKLPLYDIDILKKFKNEIMNTHCLQDHYNIIRILKDKAYIDNKILKAINSSYDVKNIKLSYNKIKAIRTLETKYNIKPLEVDFTHEGPIIMDDKEYINLKHIFRISTPKPNNYEELKKIYVSMIKKVTTNDLIESFQSAKKETRNKRLYNINDQCIRDHLELNKFYNPDCKNFHENFIERFDIPIIENKYIFDNEEEGDIEESCALLDLIL